MENKPKTKIFFYTGLSIIFLIVLIVFFISVYESLTGSKNSKTSLITNPEIIAVVIGLIVSLLFVERYKSMETQVNKLSEGPVEAIKNIQDFMKQQIDQMFTSLSSKAETLSESISGLVDKHPWLEVISEREFIVETDSCRGILRTCYALLQDAKFLHLFEYLEYCSKKGTSSDKSDKGSVIKGTADDFFELAVFCETWLGDYYLSAEFLKRYIEQYPDSAYILLPEYIRKLIRIGDLKAAGYYSKMLRRKVYGDDFYSRLRLYLRLEKSVSLKYRWLSANVLLLSDMVFEEERRAARYVHEITNNKFSALFKNRQCFFNIEIQIQLGDFQTALETLKSLEKEKPETYELSEISYLYSKIGDYVKATEVRVKVMDSYKNTFGDYASDKNGKVEKMTQSRTEKKTQNKNRSRGNGKTPPSTPKKPRGKGRPPEDGKERGE